VRQIRIVRFSGLPFQPILQAFEFGLIGIVIYQRGQEIVPAVAQIGGQVDHVVEHLAADAEAVKRARGSRPRVGIDVFEQGR
jgi:hypothetical protein